MASFVNFHVRGPLDSSVLKEALRSLDALPAFASVAGVWTSVFPPLDAKSSPEGVERFALALAARLARPVFALSAHGGEFRSWLVDAGGVIDAYATRDDDAPVGGNAERLLPFAREGTTAADLKALFQERRTRLRRDTDEFMDDWKSKRAELRTHLERNFKAGRGEDLAALLRQYDHHTSQMGAPPFDPADLSADLGRLFGFTDGLAWLDQAAILDGRAPLGSVLDLERAS